MSLRSVPPPRAQPGPSHTVKPAKSTVFRTLFPGSPVPPPTPGLLIIWVGYSWVSKPPHQLPTQCRLSNTSGPSWFQFCQTASRPPPDPPPQSVSSPSHRDRCPGYPSRRNRNRYQRLSTAGPRLSDNVTRLSNKDTRLSNAAKGCLIPVPFQV